jgi:hypothetical protein
MHKKNLWKESQEIDKLCPVGNYLKGWRWEEVNGNYLGTQNGEQCKLMTD